MKLTSNQLVKNFCSCIDELIEAWNTATDNNYKFGTTEKGEKANFIALKLGLTTLEGELPYMQSKWHWGIPKEAKEKYPNIPDELQAWKEKAKGLGPNTEIISFPIETSITKEKIEKFCRVADDAIDILEDSGSLAYAYDGGASTIRKGNLINKLALQLGLINADWYLATKCGLGYNLDFKLSKNLVQIKEPNLKLYDQLGIDPNCCKFPFIVRDEMFGNGDIDRERLEFLVEKAKNITKKSTKDTDRYYLDHPDYIILTNASINYGFSKAVLSKYANKKPGEVNYLWSIKPQRYRFFKKRDIVLLAESHSKIAINRKD